MASSSKRQTRRNPDPEKNLKAKKQSDQSYLPIFQRSTSLSSDSIKTLDGIKFDLKFEQSMFRSKSDSELSEVVIDIPRLNKFVPKYIFGFSMKDTFIFWDSLSKEIKRKLEYREQHKDSSPLNCLLKKEIKKLSKDSQAVRLVNTLTRPNQQAPIVMANIYSPLTLLSALNPMLDCYNQRIKQFGADGDLTSQQHVDWFQDFKDIEEVDEDDVKMRLFSQILKGVVNKWFRALTPGSISNYRVFKHMFLDRWEEKKNYVQMLTQYNQLKRGNDETVKIFSSRFNMIQNYLPMQCKPPQGMAKLHYAEAFDDEFALFMRERRFATLADMMNDAIEVELNMMSSKRGKYKSKTRKVKDEAQSSSDLKFDSIMKVMEKLVDKLYIVDRPVIRDNNEPRIRNPNFRQPRQQPPQQPQIIQRPKNLLMIRLDLLFNKTQLKKNTFLKMKRI